MRDVEPSEGHSLIFRLRPLLNLGLISTCRSDPQEDGQAHESRHRAFAEFFRDAHAMDFEGLLASAEVRGGLFVELAGDDVGEDLTLAGSQGGEPFAGGLGLGRNFQRGR